MQRNIQRGYQSHLKIYIKIVSQRLLDFFSIAVLTPEAVYITMPSYLLASAVTL